MEEATHVAWIMVGAEVLYRSFSCSTSLTSLLYISTNEDSNNTSNPGFKSIATPGLIFIISYTCCILAIYADVKNIKFFKTNE